MKNNRSLTNPKRLAHWHPDSAMKGLISRMQKSKKEKRAKNKSAKRIMALVSFITATNLFGVWIGALFIFGNPIFDSKGQLWLLAWLVNVLLFSGIGVFLGKFVAENLWPLKERT